METTKFERRSPCQARSRERRARILSAAKELVSRAGSTDGITTRHIADYAEVPIGSVYYLFPNLQAIYYALLTQKLSEARTGAKDEWPLVNAGWEERIDESVDTMMRFFWDTPIVSVLWDALRNHPELQELNDADNARWEASNLKFLRGVLPHLAEERLEIMSRVLVAISERLLSVSLSTDDERVRGLIADELKSNLRAYIAANIRPAA